MVKPEWLLAGLISFTFTIGIFISETVFPSTEIVFLFYSDVTSFNYTTAAKKVITWAPQIHKYKGILWNRLIYVQCWNLGIPPLYQIVYGCELKQLHSEKKSISDECYWTDVGNGKGQMLGKVNSERVKKGYLTPVWLDAHKKNESSLFIYSVGLFPFIV